MKNNPDLMRPKGLSLLADKAYDVICATLTELGLDYTGGCKTFYSPEEWREKGEEYGRKSILVIVHDGGDVGCAFSYDREAYQSIDQMCSALNKIGVYSEQCTSWYSAVYC